MKNSLVFVDSSVRSRALLEEITDKTVSIPLEMMKIDFFSFELNNFALKNEQYLQRGCSFIVNFCFFQ